MECFAGISEDDVRDISDYKVFGRGQEYYPEGMVEDVLYNIVNNTVVATVKGTTEYRIEFYVEEGGIYSTCDCPYNQMILHVCQTKPCPSFHRNQVHYRLLLVRINQL